MQGKSGFTLFEISIVLLIISLIVGGILVGRELVRNSQIRSVVSDVESFKAAILNFRDKYKELPGDYSDATTMWGDYSGGCNPTSYATVTSNINTTNATETCDGSGDLYISRLSVSPMSLLYSYGGNTCFLCALEAHLVWKHLVNAGLLTIKWDPLGTGRPAGKIPTSVYTLAWSPSASGSGVFSSTYGHFIVFGAQGFNSATASGNTGYNTTPTYRRTITAAEAAVMDQKNDDGMPGTGRVLAYTTAASDTGVLTRSPNCTNGTTSAATYSNSGTGATGIQCTPIFLLGLER